MHRTYFSESPALNEVVSLAPVSFVTTWHPPAGLTAQEAYRLVLIILLKTERIMDAT